MPETTHPFAQIAVDQPIDAELTYRIPVELAREVQLGSRVVVPLGKANRPMTGTVLGFTDTPPSLPASSAETPVAPMADLFAASDDFQALPEGISGAALPAAESGGHLKAIQDVLRDVHPVPADLIALARWIAGYYCTPIGLCLATMVPAAVKKAVRLPSLMLVHLAEAANDPEAFLAHTKLTPKARQLYERLRPLLANGPLPEAEVLEKLEIGRPMLRRLLDQGVVRLERQVRFPEASQITANAVTGAPAGEEGASPRVLDPTALVLTRDQEKALAQIEPLLEPLHFGVRLIHGVTGSGKTELYIRAIEKVVQAGRRAIVLVPEISLTPQTVRRFTQRFSRVAVLHSGLRDAQRHLHWHAIASGWAQVIVGARSAVFAPADHLGLIVVDEEHDPSYKQDNAPKYHGRDVAIRRAQMLNIPVLLGSATPALESWQNATGRSNPHYGLISLPTRPMGIQMPKVLVVDMRQQSKERRGLHILSTYLEHHLKQTLERKKQAIFLLNRRGYAHYVMCPRCDWVMMCANCSTTMVVHRGPNAPAYEAERSVQPAGVPLGYDPRHPQRASGGLKKGPTTQQISTAPDFHQRYNQVQCHYCLTSMVLPITCPLCQARLTYLGQGTQRAEDEIARKFPGVRMARMDSDSMANLGDYQRTLERFGAGEIDLIIGTQMIAKGLDFPNVALVGVLNSDLAMTMPDFRAAERTFQLICQVAGRSGRPALGKGGDERGLVVVQTYQPHEPAIVHACNHDYRGFLESELPHREPFNYPPFGRLARLVFADKGFTRAKEAADDVLRQIESICGRHQLPIRWQGPLPPPMEKLQEQYRFEIVLFAPTPGPLQRLLATLRMREAFSRCPVSLAIDVDPVHMM